MTFTVSWLRFLYMYIVQKKLPLYPPENLPVSLPSVRVPRVSGGDDSPGFLHATSNVKSLVAWSGGACFFLAGHTSNDPLVSLLPCDFYPEADCQSPPLPGCLHLLFCNSPRAFRLKKAFRSFLFLLSLIFLTLFHTS